MCGTDRLKRGLFGCLCYPLRRQRYRNGIKSWRRAEETGREKHVCWVERTDIFFWGRSNGKKTHRESAVLRLVTPMMRTSPCRFP